MDSHDLTCPHCGYNLTGLVKPICPECGVEFDPVYLRGMARKYPGHIVLGLWTIKYLPPLALIVFALLQFIFARVLYLDLVIAAVIWVCVVWIIEMFTP